MKKKVAVFGYGYVGKAYARMFEDGGYEIMVHDPAQALNITPDLLESGAGCVLAVVCVPTPMSTDGSCDTSIVEQVLKMIPRSTTVMIKSTIEPGTAQRLADELNHQCVVFSPEYIGEGGYYVPPEYPHPTQPRSHGFMIIGETAQAERNLVGREIVDLMLPIMGPTTQFRIMPSKEAELVKYFENAFLALKVMFANEMRYICGASNANYHDVREGWLMDPRVGRSHSAAFARKPGFDGKCLPKDTHALLTYCRKIDVQAPLLNALIKANGT